MLLSGHSGPRVGEHMHEAVSLLVHGGYEHAEGEGLSLKVSPDLNDDSLITGPSLRLVTCFSPSLIFLTWTAF